MDETMICLSSEKELRIYMHPLRQKVLRTLALHGRPMTAKQLADALAITPSSAKHHLVQLQSIGLVGVHHTQQIHGITAVFYTALPVTVQLGLGGDEAGQGSRLLMENTQAQIFRDFYATCRQCQVQWPQDAFVGDMFTGVVFLTQQQADALYRQLRSFLQANQVRRPDTLPFEYSLIAYNPEAKP